MLVKLYDKLWLSPPTEITSATSKMPGHTHDSDAQESNSSDSESESEESDRENGTC